MTLSVRGKVVSPSNHVPVILIHGAANSAIVWTLWQEELARGGWSSYALDLRAHGDSGDADLAHTSMADYAADVIACAREFRKPPLLMGWSMGGLVSLMAADTVGAVACVGLAPSTPARSNNPTTKPRIGEFGPEEYGIVDRDPALQPTMPDLDIEERRIALGSLGKESRFARDERSAGIVISELSSPCLIVTGTADEYWPRSRYQDFPLEADFIDVNGASHWGLVLSRRALRTLVPTVLEWVDRTLRRRAQ